MSRWTERARGPNWVMDKDGRVLGYKDVYGNVYGIPNAPSAGGMGEAAEVPTAAVGSVTWGAIIGALSNQTDLTAALAGKAASTTQSGAEWLAGVSTTETIVSPAKIAALCQAIVDLAIASAPAPAPAPAPSSVTYMATGYVADAYVA